MLTKFSEVKVSLNEREENKSKMKWNDTANTRRNTHTKQSEIIKKRNESKEIKIGGVPDIGGDIQKEITEKNEIEMRRAIDKHKTQMELQNGIIIIIIERELDEMKAVARTVMLKGGGTIQCV